MKKRKYVKVQPPLWARMLVQRVIQDRVANAIGAPRLYWFLREDGANGDATNSVHDLIHERRIRVYAPLEEGISGRYVLLHELAHVLTPGQHHTKDFWGVCFFLCKTYGDFPPGYVEQRAVNYMPGKASAVLGGEWRKRVAERKARRYKTFVSKLLPQLHDRIHSGHANCAKWCAKDIYTYGRRLVAAEKEIR